MKHLAMTTLIASLAAGAALAKPPLREVKEIDDQIFWGILAYEISEQCASLDARKFKAVSDLWSLASKAQSMGYSRDEIKTYIRSDEEKARMRTRGEAYLASRGVSYETPETFCTFGKAEIERNSAIGAYLRAK
ncbi:hypothetical protein BXY66_1913 [Shimia isoporae]|uniref:DUF5333 domain-containing protein n=1 Tax=Shimia isoporae TaxID=647720 RepID=A0A4R1NX47_9RHOB|nr:DUF5333 domain-containing protein [Shimia isoporae]TCL09848.1 hypothetical protein BXY66_1913 [Shimia isoporae]